MPTSHSSIKPATNGKHITLSPSLDSFLRGRNKEEIEVIANSMIRLASCVAPIQKSPESHWAGPLNRGVNLDVNWTRTEERTQIEILAYGHLTKDGATKPNTFDFEIEGHQITSFMIKTTLQLPWAHNFNRLASRMEVKAKPNGHLGFH